MTHSPGDLEGPEQSDASEHGEPKRGHDVLVGEDELKEGGVHHEEVKPVEEADKVTLQSQGIHLQDHFAGEQDDKEKVGRFL